MRFRTANASCPTVRICLSVWVACMHRCPRWESSLCRFGVRIVDMVVVLSGFLRCGRCVVCGRRVGVGAGITYVRVSVPLHRFHIEVSGILSLSFFPCSFVSLRSLFSFSFSLFLPLVLSCVPIPWVGVCSHVVVRVPQEAVNHRRRAAAAAKTVKYETDGLRLVSQILHWRRH